MLNQADASVDTVSRLKEHRVDNGRTGLQGLPIIFFCGQPPPTVEVVPIFSSLHFSPLW